MTRKFLSFKIRKAILERDNYKCIICGTTNRNSKLEIDHIIPIIRGGTNDFDNLCTLCIECNRGKSDDIIRIPIQKNKLQEAIEKDELEKKRQKLEELRKPKDIELKCGISWKTISDNEKKLYNIMGIDENKFEKIRDEAFEEVLVEIRQDYKDDPEVLRKIKEYEKKMKE